MIVYRSISLTGKDFRTYLENCDLKNLKIQIDITENEQSGKVFKPISDNFIIVRCEAHRLRCGFSTHLIYDFDNKTRLRIEAFTDKEDDRIRIAPEQIEDFTTQISSIEFIDNLLPDETGGDIYFWGSKLGLISTITTIDFSVKWELYHTSTQEWLKKYFPAKGLSDNFDNSLSLFSDICSYEKKFLLQLSKHKMNLVFQSLANLNTINKAFYLIEPSKLPDNTTESAVEQKKFIDSYESIILETEENLQNIYFFLNVLKATSKKDKKFWTRLKDGIRSYVFSKVIDPIISPIIGKIQDVWQFVVKIVLGS